MECSMWWSSNWEVFIAFSLGFAVVMMGICIQRLSGRVLELERKLDMETDIGREDRAFAHRRINAVERKIGEVADKEKADISSLRETLHMDEYGEWCENFGGKEKEKVRLKMDYFSFLKMARKGGKGVSQRL